ncbi:MAG TPA: hypothetical protein VJ868_08285 [Actinomycetota bacterium]|nr:hypothetical protein [Actinomycetota bacterium]
MPVRAVAAVVAGALLAACAGGPDEPPTGNGPRGLVAQVVSYDLAAGTPARLLIGLGTGANLYVSGGTVDVSIAFLGGEEATGRPQRAGEETAAFLPLPGSEGPFPDTPTAAPASTARGVYVAEDVTFDRPGFYEATVTADLEGGPRTGTSAFQVYPEPRYPAVGDRAPRTENLTVESVRRDEAPPEAVDSRAVTGGRIPDPDLHETTIADAIRAGRPALVVFATPVYCVSRFCGPVTDMVEELRGEYGDRAEFIHVEIWRDFQGRVVNRAAAEWLLRQGELLEPWVYLIGADGRIEARWDNVATRQEIEPYLRRLPPMSR